MNAIPATGPMPGGPERGGRGDLLHCTGARGIYPVTQMDSIPWLIRMAWHAGMSICDPWHLFRKDSNVDAPKSLRWCVLLKVIRRAKNYIQGGRGGKIGYVQGSFYILRHGIGIGRACRPSLEGSPSSEAPPADTSGAGCVQAPGMHAPQGKGEGDRGWGES